MGDKNQHPRKNAEAQAGGDFFSDLDAPSGERNASLHDFSPQTLRSIRRFQTVGLTPEIFIH